MPQIEKASSNNDTEIVAVMKEVKKLLKSESDDYIIKDWDDDLHPRDENGRFTSGGGGFGNASADTFAEAVTAAKVTQPQRRTWRVETPDSEEIETEHPNSKMHITKGGSTVGIDETGNIWGVCRAKGDTVNGAELLTMAVENGGVKLDSYDGNHEFYTDNGFEPVSWCKWDGQYAPSDWNSSYGEENIIFYKYVGKGNVTSEYMGDDGADNFYNAVKASKDYSKALSERDKSMK